jgi:hypothetical protein
MRTILMVSKEGSLSLLDIEDGTDLGPEIGLPAYEFNYLMRNGLNARDRERSFYRITERGDSSPVYEEV